MIYPPLPRVWVDMDGVLVNFDKHACKAHGVVYPSNTVLGHSWLYDQLGCTVDHFLDTVDQTPDFWQNLEPYPWTAALIQFLDIEFPDWRILSGGTHNGASWGGKVDWVRKHLQLPGLEKLNLVYGARKSHLCRPGDILIDDHVLNCNEWLAAGGRVFQWIAYSEDCPHALEQLERLKAFLCLAKKNR